VSLSIARVDDRQAYGQLAEKKYLHRTNLMQSHSFSEFHQPIPPYRGISLHRVSLTHEMLTERCRKFFLTNKNHTDPSHDLVHIDRVNRNQSRIAAIEGGDPDILIPAAILHDIINYPKNDSRRSSSAEESSALAASFLANLAGYPYQKIPGVTEAIRRHSFSANLPAHSLEEKIIQDADRLESIGLVALMRTFATCGSLGRQLFHPEDPFCENRTPEPSQYGLDVVYTRLFKLERLLNTETARTIAAERSQSMRVFIAGLRSEM
jgi:uncharacterized protein